MTVNDSKSRFSKEVEKLEVLVYVAGTTDDTAAAANLKTTVHFEIHWIHNWF